MAMEPTTAFIYQLVSFLSFFLVLAWAIRSRDPLNLGAILGSFMMWGFDWLYCERSFWNVTVVQNLISVPGLEIQGVRYPLAAACNWSVGFGFVPLLLSFRHVAIRRALGVWHLPVMFILFGILDIVLESLMVQGLKLYAYHQRPQYLLMGVAWSNGWMFGGYFTAAYVGLAYMRRWAALPDGVGVSPNRETTWKGLCLGMGTIIVPAFLMGVLQLWWWSAMQPWTESGRPF